MDTSDLNQAWDKFKALTFPSAPKSPQLADWLFELLEIDDFYAGIVTTILSGGRPAMLPRPNELVDLEKRLECLSVSDSEDAEIRKQCESYFAALKELHAAVVVLL